MKEIDPKTKKALASLQAALSRALKPFHFDPNSAWTQENIKRVLHETIMAHLDGVLSTPFEIEVGPCHPETDVVSLILRGPRSLLEKLDLGSLREIDDYKLRFELPDGTLWEE